MGNASNWEEEEEGRRKIRKEETISRGEELWAIGEGEMQELELPGH